MNSEELKNVLDSHILWLEDNSTGKRANLTVANLRGADLTGANLTGANLMCANLMGADLTGADLRGAYGIISMSNIGSRGGTTYFVKHTACIMVKCGCFWGTMEEFLSAVEKTHGNNRHAIVYRIACDLAVMEFAQEVKE